MKWVNEGCGCAGGGSIPGDRFSSQIGLAGYPKVINTLHSLSCLQFSSFSFSFLYHFIIIGLCRPPHQVQHNLQAILCWLEGGCLIQRRRRTWWTLRCSWGGTGLYQDPRRLGRRETVPIATLSPQEWCLHWDGQLSSNSFNVASRWAAQL